MNATREWVVFFHVWTRARTGEAGEISYIVHIRYKQRAYFVPDQPLANGLDPSLKDLIHCQRPRAPLSP